MSKLYLVGTLIYSYHNIKIENEYIVLLLRLGMTITTISKKLSSFTQEALGA